MKNAIQHPQFGQVRTQKLGNDFVFCVKDVIESLEMKQASESALRNLDEDEKLMRKVYASGQNREMLFVTESGLYALIIRSNKPEARKFRKWITAEVLPSLRKYGFYSTDERAMDRAKAKAEYATVKKLHNEVAAELSATDKRIIARQCQTDEYEVEQVLDLNKQDAYMMTLAYGRAVGNQLLNKSFYTIDGALELLQNLNNAKRITQ